MLLEKSKNEAEFIENVEKILQKTEYKKIEKLKNIIRYKAEGIIEKDEIEELLKKVKNEKEEINMTLAERIKRNEREERMKAKNEGRREGRREGKNKTIKKMLLLKLDENIIKEVTGAKDKELEKIKQELQEA